jgi:hypothetical protein
MTKPFRTVIDVRSGTQDLTTVDSVKLDLGLDPLDTSQDAWIVAQIRQASNSIASMCNRMFGEETISNYFNVQWCYHGSLQLSRVPVTEILSVDQGGTLLQATQYQVDEESGLLWSVSPGNIPWHGNWIGGAVRVQFKAGYVLLATLPYDLERAANLMIKSAFYAKTRDPTIRSEAIPGVMSFDYASGAANLNVFDDSEVGRLISPYKLPAYG